MSLAVMAYRSPMMTTPRWFVACLVLFAPTACEDAPRSDPSSTGAATSTPVASAPATTAATATTATTAATTATAAIAEERTPCEERGLDLGGKGTRDDRCKYDDDVVTARYADDIGEDGARFEVTNPWDQEVTSLSVAVYYYDAEGQQLSIAIDDEEHLAARLDGMAVKLPGGTTTTVALGWPKEKLPETVHRVEAVVLAFGWGGDDPAYFASTRPFRPYRAIDGGNGPTGIAICDTYRITLEGCSKQFPDALSAMHVSLRQYNNAAPPTRKKLAPDLERRCEEAMASSKERCTRCPDDGSDPSCFRR